MRGQIREELQNSWTTAYKQGATEKKKDGAQSLVYHLRLPFGHLYAMQGTSRPPAAGYTSMQIPHVRKGFHYRVWLRQLADLRRVLSAPVSAPFKHSSPRRSDQ
jgi:hypothetical protein